MLNEIRFNSNQFDSNQFELNDNELLELTSNTIMLCVILK
jgi:hypothetical protein